MCLAVPAKLITHNGLEGVVDLHGNHLPVNIMLTPDAQTGDWLLIHAGFAIEKLDPKQAGETWALLRDVAQAAADLPAGSQADASAHSSTDKGDRR